MASPYSAWADSLSYLHPYLSQSVAVSDTSLPSADPTGLQPFTSSKNVSYPMSSMQETTPHEHPPLSAQNMARKRHYSNGAALAPSSAAHNAAHNNAHGHDVQDFACTVAAEHCHFSPPCENPDCDEATICFDHNAHDLFPCNSDLSWCHEQSKCDNVFPYACAKDACDFDFDCNVFPCPETCHEAECQHPQHAQGCNTTCDTVACSDPQCDEGVLYCCLSDICTHKTHVDCYTPCPLDCQQVHTHCAAPIVPACHPPCNLDSETSCAVSYRDGLSASTTSTPQTDLSDSLRTPTDLQFQSLVEAAATQAFLSVPNSWEAQSQYEGFIPSSKRRKLHTKTSEQALYEQKVLDQTFSRPDSHFRDSWQDYGLNMNTDFMFSGARNDSTSAVRPMSRSEAVNQTSSSVPPEGLICKWHDENTGICNTTFTSSEDFHNHVKEHTSTLVGSRGANRDYKCRWAGCDKTDPFGTKNHLDRHMQNHTGFKPFACNICGHRCVTHQQLTNHLTTHTRSKPFVCDFPGCTKSFSVKTALSTHKRTHTNDKPFACRFCGDKYADSSNLSKHRKTVHEDERTSIPCPDPRCVYRDSRCQRLERHCRDSGHGAELYSDPMKWAEYTGKWRRKPPTLRSRTGSVAGSVV